jgi:hypothetical protein
VQFFLSRPHRPRLRGEVAVGSDNVLADARDGGKETQTGGVSEESAAAIADLEQEMHKWMSVEGVAFRLKNHLIL